MGNGGPSPRPGARSSRSTLLYPPDRIGLAANFSESSADVASLGFDGILYHRATVFGISFAQSEPEEMSEEELAELERMAAEQDARAERAGSGPTASRFLRALPGAATTGSGDPDPRGGMLFADGLSVEHTWDEEPRDHEEIESAASFFGARGGHRIRVEDDLGTEYLEGDGGSERPPRLPRPHRLHPRDPG